MFVHSPSLRSFRTGLLLDNLETSSGHFGLKGRSDCFGFSDDKIKNLEYRRKNVRAGREKFLKVKNKV